MIQRRKDASGNRSFAPVFIKKGWACRERQTHSCIRFSLQSATQLLS